jgi:2-desacetyl-2-hydroxyethyl bacteriochlorophyllide A dehydrogenase
MPIMQTVVLQEPGRFRLIDAPEPPATPAPGHALVRVHRVGVCGTDLHAFRGRQPFFTYPRVLGHELGVEVVALGAPDRDAASGGGVHVGDRCAVEPYLNCGRCIACRRGRTNCCYDLKVLGVHIDGGMCQTLHVPTHKLHRSDTLTLDQLALVETLGIGAHAVSRGRPEPGERTLVIGAGPIGLSVVQFATLAGANVAVMDVNADRLAFCRSAMQVQRCLQPGDDAPAAVRDAFDGELPTLVFDATGNAASMHAAFDLLPSTGRLVLVGLILGDITFNDPAFHRRELTLMATRNSTADDFRRIIGLIEEGQIDTTPWITHRAALAAVPDTFAQWLDPANRVVKAMIEV